MIAYNFLNGENIQIQLKGSRATVDRKYRGKNLYIAYTDRETNEICIYNHDAALDIFENTKSALSNTFKKTGYYGGLCLHKHFSELLVRLPIK